MLAIKAECDVGLLGLVSYPDVTDHLLRFPLVVIDSLGRERRFVVVAKSIRCADRSGQIPFTEDSRFTFEHRQLFAQMSETRPNFGMAPSDSASGPALVLLSYTPPTSHHVVHFLDPLTKSLPYKIHLS